MTHKELVRSAVEAYKDILDELAYEYFEFGEIECLCETTQPYYLFIVILFDTLTFMRNLS